MALPRLNLCCGPWSGFCCCAVMLGEGVQRGRSGRVGTVTMCSWCKRCCQPCCGLGNQCQGCIIRFPFLQGADTAEVSLLLKRCQFSTRSPQPVQHQPSRGPACPSRVQAAPSGYLGQPAGGVGNTCEMRHCLKILLNLEFRQSQLSCIHTEGRTLEVKVSN